MPVAFCASRGKAEGEKESLQTHWLALLLGVTGFISCLFMKTLDKMWVLDYTGSCIYIRDGGSFVL